MTAWSNDEWANEMPQKSVEPVPWYSSTTRASVWAVNAASIPASAATGA
jgi:hypothetical protein